MGAGYYVAAAHPPDMDARTVDDLAREIIADVAVGVGDTGVRAGLIGEIGCTWPWTDNEKKVVRAAVAAQRETGAPLMIHPGAQPRGAHGDRGVRAEGRRRPPAHHHVPHRSHHRRRARGARPRPDGHLARVRPLRAGDLLLPVPARLRHAQRRRPDGPRARPHGGRARRPDLAVARHRLQALPW